MDNATWQEMMAIRTEMLKALDVAMSERSRREYPEWEKHIRFTMREKVNLFRVVRGLPAVDEETIARTETSALGHIDYAKKFALYCAELAVGANR